MADQEDKKSSTESDIQKNKLIDMLSNLTDTDIEKLERIAKGEVTSEDANDNQMLDYLRLVNTLIGGHGNTSLTVNGNTRKSRYEIYDDMEENVAYISSALDILSDDATQPDEDSTVIQVRSENSKVISLTEDLFTRLEITEKVSKWARLVAKYGDFFLGLEGSEGEGVTTLHEGHYPSSVERHEVDGVLAAFVLSDETDPKEKYKAPWSIVHFRHKGDIYKEDANTGSLSRDKKYRLTGQYGQSVLMPAIKVYTQLRFVENIIILSRLTNSIRRNIFLINVGNVAPEQAISSVDMYAKLLKKDVTLDLEKGMYDSRKNSVKYDEDIFLPVSDTRNDVRIEQVGGDVNISEQYDLEYLLNKLFAALKIPKAYLNYEQDLNARSTLIQLDIRYARSVARLQQTLIGGLYRLARINLAYHGIDPNSTDLEITLSKVSSIESEIRRQETEQNINNARSFMETITTLNTTVSGGGDPMAEPDPNAKAKIDLEYAAYYAAKEFLGMRESELEKLLQFDTTRFQDKKVQNESKKLTESKVYYNSDLRASLPIGSDITEFESIRENLITYLEVPHEIN